jgi:hypothetical protein
MLAMVLADHLLRHRGQNAQVQPPLAPIPPGIDPAGRQSWAKKRRCTIRWRADQPLPMAAGAR